MGLVAAPLLAGFSVALVALVIQGERKVYCPNLVLFFLVGATLAFLATVQVTFQARQYAVTPPEIEMWWSDPAKRRESLRTEQRYHRREHRRWTNLARHSYNLGLLCFLLGLVALLIPREGIDDASHGRVVVLVLAMLGLVLEAAWITYSYRGNTEFKDLPPPPGPESGV